MIWLKLPLFAWPKVFTLKLYTIFNNKIARENFIKLPETVGNRCYFFALKAHDTRMEIPKIIILYVF
jgi:hypothetical protein